MSRYHAKLPNGRTIAWGFDSDVPEYFLQESKSKSELVEGNKDDDIIFSIGNYMTTVGYPKFPHKLQYSNSEILDLMNQYREIPEKHKQAVAMDLPF